MTNERQYCVVIGPDHVETGTRAALLDETRWKAGDEIRVRFLEGDPDLQDRVEAVAKEWTGSQMANLSLQFVPSGEADIRIAFVQGDGSWSVLGTVCHQVPQAEATMNYGWLTPDSSDDEIGRVVRHEFGHALGLIHEHQNPDTPIAWNRAAVIAALSGPPNNWDPATIEHNIFHREQPEALTSTPTDRLSIMMYPIPRAWTTDGFSAGLNSEMSETDKAFIREAYPW